MPKERVWLHTLIVPSGRTAEVRRFVEARQADIEVCYEALLDKYHASKTDPPFSILKVVARPRSVVIHVTPARGVRVNLLTKALASVLPADLDVKYPTWS